jgi:hypothetical protein
MSEHGIFGPLQPEQSPDTRGLTQVDLENLYLRTTRGVAALPENVEYDVREESPLIIEGLGYGL